LRDHETEAEDPGGEAPHARQYRTSRALDTPGAHRINGRAVHPFTQDREDFDRLGARTVAMLGEYLRALHAQPVDRVVPDDVRRRLMTQPLPEQGLAPEEMLEFLRREILPWPIAIGHRRSYGWVNSPPAPISILADAVATTMNCGLDGYDHAALFLMASVGRWIMDLVGFPASGSLCLLLSGGSAATLNALTAARHRAAERAGWNPRAEGLQGGRRRLVMYASSESHSSIQKCVEQLGIGTDNLRGIPVDDDFRMQPEALRRAMSSHTSQNRSTSARVVVQPKLTRIVRSARSSARPIAVRTWLRFIVPDEQAEPWLTAMPAMSNRINWAWAERRGMAQDCLRQCRRPLVERPGGCHPRVYRRQLVRRSQTHRHLGLERRRNEHAECDVPVPRRVLGRRGRCPRAGSKAVRHDLSRTLHGPAGAERRRLSRRVRHQLR
jgi:hypothetical protein